VLALGAPAPPPTVHLDGVRAEYIDLSGNDWHLDTTCHLINTSLTTPLVLQDVQILGPGGRTDVIATYAGLSGTSLPPLGELRLAIDGSIPGVTPLTAVGTHGVRNVIFAWKGPAEALNLTAVLERYAPSSVDDRAHIVASGYEVTY